MSAPEVAIAHRDEHLLVLIKPPGLPTTSPAGMRGASLATIARGLDPSAPRMHPSSRLDRDVTGLVTFARTDRAIEALLEARREGRYRRTYLAIVRPTGVIDVAGAWSWAIAIDPRDPRLRIALAPGEHGEREQDARTRFAVRAGAGDCALLHLFPETGRTHQLRVHCARAGAPIVGDTDYGGVARIALPDGRVVTPRRPMLHCAMLALPDVERGGTLELFADAPEDLARTWAGVGGDRGALALGRDRDRGA